MTTQHTPDLHALVTRSATLVDCGCEARVHRDGSGIELDYCALHDSAPDLLAALRDLLSAHENWNKPCPPSVVQAARAAISKAEGV